MNRLNPEQTFNFLPVPTDIHFGYGVLNTLPERIRSLGARRVFLITDKGIGAAGILQKALDLLSSAQIACEVYDDVKPDSGSKLIAEAAERLRKCKAEVVIGIGGGSSLDTAKAVATLATNPRFTRSQFFPEGLYLFVGTAGVVLIIIWRRWQREALELKREIDGLGAMRGH